MRLLLISEYYLDKTNANANCVCAVVAGLCLRGHSVHVVCGATLNQDIEITTNDGRSKLFPVPVASRETLRRSEYTWSVYWLKRVKSIIKKGTKIFQFPLQYNVSASNLFLKAFHLTQENTYDAVLAVNKTIESVYAAIWLKQRTGIKTILYELDPMVNEIDAHLGLTQVLTPIAKAKEISLYRTFDNIVHMMCNKKKYSKAKYQCLASRSYFLDFPVFHECKVRELVHLKLKPERIRLICVGTLDSVYRPPFYFIGVLEELKKTNDVCIDFYTKGNCEPALSILSRQTNAFINVHGYVSQDTLKTKISESDIILSIGNRYSDMVPSKTFELLSYLKPIVHLSLQPQDASALYLSKYSGALILDEMEGTRCSVVKMERFIDQLFSGEIVVNPNALNNTFIKNTPLYTAKSIETIVIGGVSE